MPTTSNPSNQPAAENETQKSHPRTIAYPHKTILRRFGAANKIKINHLPLYMQEQQRQHQQLPNRISAELNINEIGNLNQTTAMDATKTLIKNNDTDATMSQCLTRSNTFVCDGIDAAQTKLLSVTHNVSIDTTLQSHSHQDNNKYQLNKERTFKRSLSPIPGETMNAAKRKSVQSILDRKVMSGPILNSTPHNSKTFADGKLPFFSAHSTMMATGDMDASHMENQQTFAMENTMVVFNNNNDCLANKFVPDAVESNDASNSTMQNNNPRRAFDLTQTVYGMADMPNSTQTIGNCTVATDHDAKFIDDGTFSSSPCVSNKSKTDDGDLTKTINGKCAQLRFLLFFFVFFRCFCCGSSSSLYVMQRHMENSNAFFSSFVYFSSIFSSFSRKNAADSNSFWSIER